MKAQIEGICSGPGQPSVFSEEKISLLVFIFKEKLAARGKLRSILFLIRAAKCPQILEEKEDVLSKFFGTVTQEQNKKSSVQSHSKKKKTLQKRI